MSAGDDKRPVLVIVMGASACGKSTVGIECAKQLGLPFVDGDDLHPVSNVQKMSSGQPLTDEDRDPWLKSIRRTAIELTSPAGIRGLKHFADTPDQQLAPTLPSNTELAATISKVKKETIEFLKDEREGDDSSKRRRGLIVGCSALKKMYRDVLRGKGVDEEACTTYFVYLHGSRPLLLTRITNRPGHFFKANMLDSQLQTLEEPPADEDERERGDCAVVDLGKGEELAEERGIQAVVDDCVQWVKQHL